jgi:DUF4097 and DUF4098 domain-containing protein YvlB
VPKRLPVFLLISVVLLSLSASAEEWRKTFSTSGKPEIRIETNDADIRVSSSDRKDIEAVVTTEGYKIGPNDVRVTDRQTGDRLELEVHIPQAHFHIFNVRNRYVRIELSIPRRADLDLHSGDGDIKVASVDGNLALRTGDGNVRLESSKGDVHLETGDGDVECREFEGQLKAETHDGNVRAQGVFSALDLHTGDGNIEAEVGSGSKMSSAWSLRTGDGNINLRLPDGFAADLDAHSGDGKVNVDFPVTIEGSLRENTIRGKMNGGGQPLELKSGDGDISLRKS